MIKNKTDKSLKSYLSKEPFLILAVMLVLVLVLTPVYNKYLNKSHLASDKRLAADIRTAMMDAAGDSGAVQVPGNGVGAAEAPMRIGESPDSPGAEEDGYWAAVYGRLGVRGSQDLNGQLKYDDGEIFYYTDDAGNIFVVVDYASRPDLIMPEA